MQARFVKGNYPTRDYTPAAAVAAGAVVVIGDKVEGICHRSIEANQLGALSTGGNAIYDIVKDNSDVADGDLLYWDADGSPVGGVALSGAATKTASGNLAFAVAVEAAGTTDGKVRARVDLNMV